MRWRLTRESWPLRTPFRISRDIMEALPLVHLEIEANGIRGCAEAAGVDYEGETQEAIARQIEAYLSERKTLPTRAELRRDMPRGGARNALDCALWDLEAKAAGVRVWTIAGLAPPRARICTYTLSLTTPAEMARTAGDAPAGATLKLKLGGGDGLDLDRVEAVREAVPSARLIADANEGWTLSELNQLAPQLEALGVELIEQPLPREQDHQLADYCGAVPLCADESFTDSASIARLGAYEYLNIKLDKTGGLTEALVAADRASRAGHKLFVGCMLGTSLGMAPAFLIAQSCEFADLDGPLLLAGDRPHAMRFEGAALQPFDSALWG